MASKSSSLALFFALNILFFTLTNATDCGCNPSPLVPIPSVPIPSVPIPSVPIPSVPSPSTPGSSENCPIDTLKLGVCGKVVSSLLNIRLGQPSTRSCCSLVHGLVDLDAAVCLCTALKANILGMDLNIPISLSLLLNACDKNLPSGFQCK